MPIDRTTCSSSRHGDHVSYTRYGCRCPDAREDERLYRKRLREGRLPPGRIPGLGTVRRLQALTAHGYAPADLAHHLGSSRCEVQRLRAGHSPLVLRSTALRVAAVYDRLALTPGPSNRARLLGQRNRWYPPLCWDDEDLDDPAGQPDRRALRRPTKGRIHLDDVDELTHLGLTPEAIAERLDVDPQSLGQARRRASKRTARDAALIAHHDATQAVDDTREVA